MSKIVAVKHRGLEAYKTDDGRVLSTASALEAANKGQLEGVSSFTTRDGDASIRSDRGQTGYSLDSLPEFSE